MLRLLYIIFDFNYIGSCIMGKPYTFINEFLEKGINNAFLIVGIIYILLWYIKRQKHDKSAFIVLFCLVCPARIELTSKESESFILSVKLWAEIKYPLDFIRS